MPHLIATVLLLGLAGYTAIGGVVAMLLLTRDTRRLDTGVAGAPIGFKILIAPGLIAMWPWFLTRAARHGAAL